MAIHALASDLFGLLYGAMLPMFPWKPILTAGFIAPFLWTGILYSAIGVISPILDARINWPWFIVSQIAFGLVCGFVVNLHVKVRSQLHSFKPCHSPIRAGLHGDQIETKDDKEIDWRPSNPRGTLHSASSRFALLRSAAITFPAVLELDPQSCAPMKCFPSLCFIKKLRRLSRGKRQEWSGDPACQSRLSRCRRRRPFASNASRMAFQVSSCRLSQSSQAAC